MSFMSRSCFTRRRAKSRSVISATAISRRADQVKDREAVPGHCARHGDNLGAERSARANVDEDGVALMALSVKGEESIFEAR